MGKPDTIWLPYYANFYSIMFEIIVMLVMIIFNFMFYFTIKQLYYLSSIYSIISVKFQIWNMEVLNSNFVRPLKYTKFYVQEDTSQQADSRIKTSFEWLFVFQRWILTKESLKNIFINISFTVFDINIICKWIK